VYELRGEVPLVPVAPVAPVLLPDVAAALVAAPVEPAVPVMLDPFDAFINMNPPALGLADAAPGEPLLIRQPVTVTDCG